MAHDPYVVLIPVNVLEDIRALSSRRSFMISWFGEVERREGNQLCITKIHLTKQVSSATVSTVYPEGMEELFSLADRILCWGLTSKDPEPKPSAHDNTTLREISSLSTSDFFVRILGGPTGDLRVEVILEQGKSAIMSVEWRTIEATADPIEWETLIHEKVQTMSSPSGGWTH